MHAKPLGKLEKQVMDILWDCRKCTVQDVTDTIRKKRDIAYTTVATILQRLYDKELVRRRKSGASYIYASRIHKKSYLKVVSQSFLEKLIGSFGDVAIASFAESIEDLPKKKREKLLRLLDEYEKSK